MLIGVLPRKICGSRLMSSRNRYFVGGIRYFKRYGGAVLNLEMTPDSSLLPDAASTRVTMPLSLIVTKSVF